MKTTFAALPCLIIQNTTLETCLDSKQYYNHGRNAWKIDARCREEDAAYDEKAVVKEADTHHLK